MLKFLVFIIVMYYVVPFVSKYFLRRFINNQVNKVQDEFKKNTASQPKTEGEVKVEYAPKKDSKEHLKGGEYVDYEEVK